MIIWLFLALVVIIISFILAYNSMKDFSQTPSSQEPLGIFLIRNITYLDNNLLEKLHQKLLKNSKIVSLERLFKGGKEAVILVGEKDSAAEFPELNLLELEDYSSRVTEAIVWEIGTKDQENFHSDSQISLADFSKSFPTLAEDEQIWLQLLLKPNKDKKTFTSQIRAAVISPRAKEVASQLINLAAGKLTKFPRPITTSEMLNFYKRRAFYTPDKNKFHLNNGEILAFTKN
jgi:hypothetical protein